jgi:chloride channel 7
VLLQAKADFQLTPIPGDTRGRITFRYDVRDFAKPVSSKGVSIHDINISPAEMEMYIDLEPFVNPTPYIVPEDMSLTKVYNLFRQLGLRHICVVPRPSRVLGVITRQDLLPEVRLTWC